MTSAPAPGGRGEAPRPLRCVTILSTKSAGSSILQSVIRRQFGARAVARTRHYEQETLFWTKAASALRLPQIRLPASEVPIPRRKAARELATFVAENADGGRLEAVTRPAIFRAFEAICAANGPLFVEKTPHHLYQKAALDLILEFSAASERVDMRLLGLVRNPVDTAYSAWKRFGVPPWIEERYWRIAYENLLALRDAAPERVTILRYEDLASGQLSIEELGRRIGVPPSGEETGLSADRIRKWTQDESFGFRPAPETVALARRYGYAEESLVGSDRPWPPGSRLRLEIEYRSPAAARLWRRARRGLARLTR